MCNYGQETLFLETLGFEEILHCTGIHSNLKINLALIEQRMYQISNNGIRLQEESPLNKKKNKDRGYLQFDE